MASHSKKPPRFAGAVLASLFAGWGPRASDPKVESTFGKNPMLKHVIWRNFPPSSAIALEGPLR
jgi:hypothetical protein